MNLRPSLASGAFAALAVTGLGIAVTGTSAYAAPTADSALAAAIELPGVDPAGTGAVDDPGAARLGWRWLARLTPEQRQCLAKAGLTRPAFPMTDAEKAALQTKVREAATGCGITLPTGERAAALKKWWGGLSDTQQSCLKEAGVNRPLGRLSAAERATLRTQVKAAPDKCGVSLPAPVKAGNGSPAQG